MTWTMTRTMRAGWPTLLALMLAAGPTLAQDAGAGDDGGSVDAGTTDGGEGIDVGTDGMTPDEALVDPILYTDYAPLPDEAVMDDGAIEGELASGDGGELGGGDGLPTDSVCDGCEYETTGVVQNDAGPLAPVATRSRQGRDTPVARAESENICTSPEHYVAWLCEWQGFAQP